MSSSATMPVEPAVPAGRMYAALVGIGVVCGLLIVLAFVLTAPTIERKKAEALERAVFEVLPGTESIAHFRLRGDGAFERAETTRPGEALVHPGYDAAGELIGLALEARAMGYGDTIRILYGYSVEREEIVGLKVLESKETPGLGDRIETDPAFRDNFRALDARLGAEGRALAHAIRTVKHGEKGNPWEIDGITGATISSQAIGRALDASASLWLPEVRVRLDDFRGKE